MRTHRPHHRELALAALLAAASHPAWATDYTWTGGSGNWFTGSNWSLGIAPNSSTADVQIDGSTSTDSSVTLFDNASIRNLNIGAGDELILAHGSTLTSYASTVVNNGTLSMANGTGNTRWLLAGNVLLSGSGQTLMVNNSGNYIGSLGQTPVPTLTIGAGHTLRGGGYLGYFGFGKVNVANRGTIRAEGVGLVFGGDSFNNNAGRVQVAGGSSFNLEGGSFGGGTVEGLGSGALLTSSGRAGTGVGTGLGNGVFDNVTLAGSLTVPNNNVLNVIGDINNNGTLNIAGTGDYTYLNLSGNTTLSGSGITQLGTRSTDQIRTSLTDTTLTISGGHTLSSSGGSIGAFGGMALVNRGTLRTESGITSVLTFANDSFRNQGTIIVGASSGLDATGQILRQTIGATTLQVDGTLTVQQLELATGSLTGTGTIIGFVHGVGGTIAPGHSPGTLSITGGLALSAGSHIALDAAGLTRGTQYDWLAVTGNAELGGDVQLSFESGYLPQIGDSFTFLTTASGTVTGTFDAVLAEGYTLGVSYQLHDVTITVTGVVAVPEPADWALMLSGIAALALLARRRKTSA